MKLKSLLSIFILITVIFTSFFSSVNSVKAIAVVNHEISNSDPGHIAGTAADISHEIIGGLHLAEGVTTALGTTTDTALHVKDTIEEGTNLTAGFVEAGLLTSVCELAEGSFFENLLDNIGNSLADVGDQTKTTGTFFISKKITQLQIQRKCLDGYMKGAETLAQSPTDRDKAAARTAKQIISEKINTNKQRLDDYQAQQKAQLQDIFKAIALSIALELNKTLTTKVVNDLKSKLKIDQYMEYADALADMVYAREYIDKNYQGDKEEQLMLMYILRAQQLGSNVVGSNTYLNNARFIAESRSRRKSVSQTKTAQWEGTQWYEDISKMANPNGFGNEEYQQAQEKVQQVLAKSRDTARLEIENGTGFKATRGCQDRTADQKRIDDIMNRQVADADAAYEAYRYFLENRNNEEITKDPDFETKFKQAEATYNQTMENLTNASSQQVSNAVIKFCEAIESPANFLATSIQEFLSKQLGQIFDVKSENVPLYARIAGKYTSNFINNMLFGGNKKLLTGKGLLEIALAAGTQAAISSTINSGNQLSKQSITHQVTDRAGGTVKITWDVTRYKDAAKAKLYFKQEGQGSSYTVYRAQLPNKGSETLNNICEETTFMIVGLKSDGSEIEDTKSTTTVDSSELNCGPGTDIIINPTDGDPIPNDYPGGGDDDGNTAFRNNSQLGQVAGQNTILPRGPQIYGGIR